MTIIFTPTGAALAAIKAVRTGGEIICGVLARSYALPEQAAAAFGLLGRADIYCEIELDEALAVLATVIHQDMAYGCEFAPLPHAQVLARGFLQSLPQPAARYYTNGTFGKNRDQPRKSAAVGASWTPATDATFDTGVLVLGENVTACLWFADED